MQKKKKNLDIDQRNVKLVMGFSKDQWKEQAGSLNRQRSAIISDLQASNKVKESGVMKYIYMTPSLPW